MNRTVLLPTTPKRIVSLVPSQTQFLYHLGLDEQVVGITKFCIHPKEWRDKKTKIGGTKNISLEKIKALRPDLIIGNKEENRREDIEALEFLAPVWISDISSLPDALEMMLEVGKIVDKEAKANDIVLKIKQDFGSLKMNTPRKKVLYIIWNDPIISVGQNTFINDLLNRCGWENVIKLERYPELNLPHTLSPDWVFLSSEPFPFQEKHIANFKAHFPTAKIQLVDGEMFSWYGSKLLEAPRYFAELFAELK